MKKLIKVIYYLLTVFFALELSMFTFSSPFKREAMDIMEIPYMKEVFMGLAALIILVSIVKIAVTILEKSDDRYLNLYEDEGLVSISEDAIRNCVSNSFKKFDEVIEETIKVKIKNDDESSVVIDAKCGLDEDLCKKKGYFDHLEEVAEEEVPEQIQAAMSVINDEEKTVKMGMNELCSLIQANVHKNLEGFISHRVEEVNIKFYNIRKKPEKPEKVKVDKKHIKKKKKRVN